MSGLGLGLGFGFKHDVIVYFISSTMGGGKCWRKKQLWQMQAGGDWHGGWKATIKKQNGIFFQKQSK